MSSFEPSWSKLFGKGRQVPGYRGQARSKARSVRRFAAVSLALIAAPLLVACGDGGFKPLYADLGGGRPTSEKLAHLQVAPIPGRVGQQIRNEFIFQANGGANPLRPEYRVEVAVRESVVSTLVQRSGDARSQVYNLDAKFKVVRLADKKVVLTGTSYGRAGFERFNSIFSNVRARREAEDRAAKTVATDLIARLSAFMATSA